MKLPSSVMTARPWIVEEIAYDFRLLDVWALPAVGERDEFSTLLEGVASFDPEASQSAASRFLFAARLRLGDWFGWDDGEARPIPGCSETSLSVRVPERLRGSARTPELSEALRGSGATPLYRTDDEWAIEISNATVHGVLHLGWVDQGDGRYRGQLAVYVKPRGPLGEAYLLAIEPFRRFVVYPALMREIGRAWLRR